MRVPGSRIHGDQGSVSFTPLMYGLILIISVVYMYICTIYVCINSHTRICIDLVIHTDVCVHISTHSHDYIHLYGMHVLYFSEGLIRCGFFSSALG